jgi:hypothetical protein
MKFDQKWVKVLGIAMSLPSTIFVTAYGSFKLSELGYLSKVQAVLLFLAIVCNMLFMMVYYALKKKNKS